MWKVARICPFFLCEFTVFGYQSFVYLGAVYMILAGLAIYQSFVYLGAVYMDLPWQASLAIIRILLWL